MRPLIRVLQIHVRSQFQGPAVLTLLFAFAPRDKVLPRMHCKTRPGRITSCKYLRCHSIHRQKGESERKLKKIPGSSQQARRTRFTGRRASVECPWTFKKYTQETRDVSSGGIEDSMSTFRMRSSSAKRGSLTARWIFDRYIKRPGI